MTDGRTVVMKGMLGRRESSLAFPGSRAFYEA